MTKTSWVELCVSDFEQSIAWFERVLGSSHTIKLGERMVDLSQGVLSPDAAPGIGFEGDVEAVVEGPVGVVASPLLEAAIDPLGHLVRLAGLYETPDEYTAGAQDACAQDLGRQSRRLETPCAYPPPWGPKRAFPRVRPGSRRESTSPQRNRCRRNGYNGSR